MNPAPFDATAAQLDDGVRAIVVRGELDLSTASELEGLLDEAISVKDALVLVDLTDCEFIDSTGIALIVRAWQQLDADADGEGSGRVVVCSDKEQVRRVLEITGLGSSIQIYGTRDAALSALRG